MQMSKLFVAMLLGLLTAHFAYAQKQVLPAVAAPALDLSIQYDDRVLTSDGLLRETHYAELMLRRQGHVWIARVLPQAATTLHAHAESGAEHEHKHFNPVALPRHIFQENGQVKIEFIDHAEKQVINIVATEFENVHFDGSWVNANYLVDPALVAAMPLSKSRTATAPLRWHEQQKNGVFQRVLWDEKNLIPRTIETGRNDGSIFRKISVSVKPSASDSRPWQDVKGYVQKEYSDFLD